MPYSPDPNWVTVNCKFCGCYVANYFTKGEDSRPDNDCNRCDGSLVNARWRRRVQRRKNRYEKFIADFDFKGNNRIFSNQQKYYKIESIIEIYLIPSERSQRTSNI